jgi:hypothetical protein
VAVALLLTGCGSSKHERPAATTRAQPTRYNPTIQSKIIEACESLSYTAESCQEVLKETEHVVPIKELAVSAVGAGLKEEEEHRYAGTQQEKANAAAAPAFKRYLNGLVHTVIEGMEKEGHTFSQTTPQASSTTSREENQGSATEGPSGCMPGTGPGTADPQCQPRPGSPDYQPPSLLIDGRTGSHSPPPEIDIPQRHATARQCTSIPDLLTTDAHIYALPQQFPGTYNNRAAPVYVENTKLSRFGGK